MNKEAVDLDVIVVGGGLAGAALGRQLALEGVRVLIIERTKSFRDRVRGEGLLPWGVNEARDLGIYDLLRETCGVEIRYWTSHAWKNRPPRDLVATTPRGAPCLTFYHPDMQEVLLGAAEAAGAEVRRGVTVTEVRPGQPPQVVVKSDGSSETLESRVVVGADGRDSKMRTWGNFDLIRDPERLCVAGVLLHDVAGPNDSVHVFRRSSEGVGVLLFPIDEARMRTYFIYRKREKRRGFSGTARLAAFFDACVDAGVPRDWLDGASDAGPLAEFGAADSWVRHPYRDGVALVGDAASSNDPSWGNGLSLAIRDVRVLKTSLLDNDDWDIAGRNYADLHGEYFGSVNRLTRWLSELMYEIGPEADALRERALPLLAKDPSRGPDYISLGPDSPSDETVRQRLFGEV